MTETAKHFIDAVKFAVANGKGKDYEFRDPGETLESSYIQMVRLTKEHDLNGWDICIKDYQDAFLCDKVEG